MCDSIGYLNMVIKVEYILKEFAGDVNDGNNGRFDSDIQRRLRMRTITTMVTAVAVIRTGSIQQLSR